MLYILYGTEPVIIKQKVDQIKKESGLDNLSWSYYDLENSNLKDIIEEANSGSLFSTKRGIYVENAYIFTGTTNKKLPEQDTKLLERYFDTMNEDTILVFSVFKEKLDVRKKITKKIQEVGKAINLNVKNNDVSIIKDMFKPCNISFDNCVYFKNRIGNDLGILNQEAKKILVFKENKGEVTKEDIVNLTTSNVDMDLFHLLDNIVSDNKKAALESFEEMLKHGEEPFVIIINLANQFRIFYQVKTLFEKGYNGKSIAEYLKIHPFRVKKALERRQQFDSKQLLSYLDKLADLDFKIKSGGIDKKIGLELFILDKDCCI